MKTKEETELKKARRDAEGLISKMAAEKTMMDVLCSHRLTLGDTAAAMSSPDYKERFRAEYVQTKIRYEKLKAFNNRIDAAFRTLGVCPGDVADKRVEMPAHDCPADLLREQQSVMGQYLHILEVRAVIEDIDLSNY